jgi:hypothetical protein
VWTTFNKTYYCAPYHSNGRLRGLTTPYMSPEVPSLQNVSACQVHGKLPSWLAMHVRVWVAHVRRSRGKFFFFSSAISILSNIPDKGQTTGPGLACKEPINCAPSIVLCSMHLEWSIPLFLSICLNSRQPPWLAAVFDTKHCVLPTRLSISACLQKQIPSSSMSPRILRSTSMPINCD